MYVEALFKVCPAQPVFFVAEPRKEEEPLKFRMDADELVIDIPDERSDGDEKEEDN
jgi:hypothetical protein